MNRTIFPISQFLLNIVFNFFPFNQVALFPLLIVTSFFFLIFFFFFTNLAHLNKCPRKLSYSFLKVLSLSFLVEGIETITADDDLLDTVIWII